jgi:hypothetical protein
MSVRIVSSLRFALCCTAAFLLLAGTASASEPDAVLVQGASPDAVVVVSDAAVSDAPVSFDFPQPSQDQSRPPADVKPNIDCGYCSVWSACGLNAQCWFSMSHGFCTVPQGAPPCQSCYDSSSCVM